VAKRKPDQIVVESAGTAFDGFESLEITNDITGPSEARLVIGDDGAWEELEQKVKPGTEWKVKLNNRLRLTGRAEVNEIPSDPDSGTLVQLTVRTKRTDAMVRSAEPVTVQNTTIKAFILALYGQLGYGEADFVFGEFADVELMTGKSGAGKANVDNLASITVEQAKVQPPETIHECAERHLKRYQATHWDGPDGKIIVGRPDDTQAPRYVLLAKRGAKSGNNVLRCQRVIDWTDVPRKVRVYGHTFGRDITSSHFSGEAQDDDVDAVAAATGHFDRLVIVQDQQSKAADAAAKTAQRELSARIRRKHAWELETDGWSWWNGSEQVPWAPNTTVEVDVEAGGPKGTFLIVRTVLKLDLEGAATTAITCVAPGVWQL